MNRRNFLRRASACGVAGLVALSALHDASAAAARYRVVARGRVAGGGAPPLVAPSGAWAATGAAGSGGSAPSDPPRVHAKPVIQWYTIPGQRLMANTVIGVAADAKGSVASVTFWIEGTTQTVSRSLYTYTDVNGVSQTLDGYFITLNVLAAVTAFATGTVRCYATATANDGTMEARRSEALDLKPRAPNAATVSGLAATFYVRADGASVTDAKGSHSSYTTLDLAWAALVAAAPESAEVVIDQTGSYELGHAVSYYGGHTGHVVLRHSAGVTATLIRDTAFRDQNPAGAGGVLAWEWWPYTNEIEFRGSGIKLDMANWNNIRCNTETPHWFNGCQIINSVGARDSLYFNKAPHTGLGIASSSGSLQGYFTDGSSQYVDLASSIKMAVNWQARDQLTGRHGDFHFAYNLYETGSDPRYFTAVKNAISVTYSGAGTATIVTNPTTNTLDCKVNGTSQTGFPVTLGNKPSPSAGPFSMADVATLISAIPGGNWLATSTGLADDRACWTLAQDSTVTTTITSGTMLTSFFAYHTEWLHIFNTGKENYLFLDVNCRKSFFATSPLNCVSTDDFVARNCFWESAAQDSQNGGCAGNHTVIENCVIDAPFAIYAADSYSSLRQTLLAAAGFGVGSGLSSMPTYPLFQDNALVTPLLTGMDGTNTSLANYAAFAALFTDKTPGDFRPSGTMPTAAKLDSYDGRRAARAATEAIGPWKTGGAAPSYAF